MMRARDITYQKEKVPIQKRLLSLSGYYHMYEASILKPTDRVELIKGVLFTVSPTGSYHVTDTRSINRYFCQLPGDQAAMGIIDHAFH